MNDFKANPGKIFLSFLKEGVFTINSILLLTLIHLSFFLIMLLIDLWKFQFVDYYDCYLNTFQNKHPQTKDCKFRVNYQVWLDKIDPNYPQSSVSDVN